MTGLRKAWAFLRRDVQTALSYKVSFAIEAVNIVLVVSAYFFFSRLLAGRSPDGYESFAFILVGIAVKGAMSTALSAYAQGIANETGRAPVRSRPSSRHGPHRPP